MSRTGFRLRQMLEAGACTRCRLCAEVCPAASAAASGGLAPLTRLRGVETLLLRDRRLLSRLLRRRPPDPQTLERFAEDAFRCTLCGRCETVCPLGIRLKELWAALRGELVRRKRFPAKIEAIRRHLEESRNVFGEDNAERAEWVEEMRRPPDHGFRKERAEVVYFTGCVAAYFPLAQKIPVAFAEILEAAGADFTLLGEEEWCCGFPMLGAGLMEMFAAFREHNLAAVEGRGAKRAVFACPSCYRMWREHYGAAVELLSAPELLLSLLRAGRIPLKELPLAVTYHDPCDLGRGAGVYEAPRELLRAIPGLRLVELAHHGEDCLCCGGGGNLEMVDPELAARIAAAKIEEVLATGARAVVTACQQCVRVMTGHVRRNRVPLEVLDIVQLLRRALAEPKRPPD